MGGFARKHAINVADLRNTPLEDPSISSELLTPRLRYALGLYTRIDKPQPADQHRGLLIFDSSSAARNTGSISIDTAGLAVLDALVLKLRGEDVKLESRDSKARGAIFEAEGEDHGSRDHHRHRGPRSSSYMC